MLPRIDAEERLSHIDSSAVAFGSLEQRDSQKVIRQLEEQRDGVSRKPSKATPDELAAMGIAVSFQQEQANG